MEKARTHSGALNTVLALCTVSESGLLWISACIPKAADRMTSSANKLNRGLTSMLFPIKASEVNKSGKDRANVTPLLINI